MVRVAAVAIKSAKNAAKTRPGYCAINGNSARKGRKLRARGRRFASSSIWATASAASFRDKVQDPFFVNLLRL
jgi:hypothetical protein